MTGTNFGTVERVAGATYPDTGLIWAEDGNFLDGTAYSSLQIECKDNTGTTAFTTKTTGITGQVGTATTPSFLIAWATADLGSLAAGYYKCEFTATHTASSRPRKGQFNLVIVAQL